MRRTGKILTPFYRLGRRQIAASVDAEISLDRTSVSKSACRRHYGWQRPLSAYRAALQAIAVATEPCGARCADEINRYSDDLRRTPVVSSAIKIAIFAKLLRTFHPS